MERKRLCSDCISCIAKKQLEKYPKEASEKERIAYKQRVLQILANAQLTDSAPFLVKQINDVQKEMFDVSTDYTETKKYFNNYVMEKNSKIEQEISEASDPLLRALQYSMTGNYIDFGAMEKIDEEKFEELLDGAKHIIFDENQYIQFQKDLSSAETFVILTDNCGEVVFDLALIKTLKKLYPKLSMTAIVRGEPVLNDATMEDAKQIGLTEEICVIGNGSGVAGTCLEDISQEALRTLNEADVILSKGLGNFETLNGCGMNIYYLFMCKCHMFADRFHKNLYEGMLLNDKFVSY